MDLTFRQLSIVNKMRCKDEFSFVDSWSFTNWIKWGYDLVKEMELVCNRLIEDSSVKAKKDVGYEIADAIIYADLLCTKLGLSLEECIKDRFNIVSDSVGSTIKI